MGEIADAILDGVFCEVCGEFIESVPPGHPRKCESCEREYQKQKEDKK